MITYDIDLCLGMENQGTSITVKCCDTGVNIRTHLYVCRLGKWRDIHEPYIVPEGYTPVIKIAKPDNTYFVKDGIVVADGVLFETKPQAFTAAGIAEAEVSLYAENGERITTATFTINIPAECTSKCEGESGDYVDVMCEKIKAAIAEASEAAIAKAIEVEKQIQGLAQETTDALNHMAEGIDSACQKAEQAQTIAKGRATGYVFDTIEDMNLWLSDPEHKANLMTGDNLYIRAVDVPDFWWDGTQPQQLETQKVDLSEYVKSTDYITKDRAGLVCVKDYISGTRGIIKDHESGLEGSIAIKLANEVAIDYKGQKYQPIVPANLDYAVKSAVSTNRITMTAAEKKAACKWFGTLNVIENSDNTITVILPSGKQKTVDLSIIEIFT